jgi:hypothetical protein
MSFKMRLGASCETGGLAIRLRKRGAGVFAQHLVLHNSKLSSRYNIRLERGSSPLIDLSEPGDVFELVYLITVTELPFYALIEQRQVEHVIIKRFKLVLKSTEGELHEGLNEAINRVRLPGDDAFETHWGFDSIKRIEFMGRWGYTDMREISHTTTTLGSVAFGKSIGTEFIIFRSACTGDVLEALTSPDEGPGMVTAATPVVGNKFQIWRWKYIRNRYTYPYIFAVAQNCGNGLLLTGQRRDDTDDSAYFPVWSQSNVLLDVPDSRSLTWSTATATNGYEAKDKYFYQKWNMIRCGRVCMLVHAETELAMELCLQAERPPQGNHCITLTPLSYQRRQAWFIDPALSHRATLLLFLCSAGFRSPSTSVLPVLGPKHVKAVFYNEDLMANILGCCTKSVAVEYMPGA